jgi:hypothetical protein
MMRLLVICLLFLAAACSEPETTTVSLRVYPAEGMMHDDILRSGSASFMEIVLSGGTRPFVSRFALNGNKGELVDIPVGAGLQLTARGYSTNPDGSAGLVFYGGTPYFSVADGEPLSVSLQVGHSDCVGYNRPSVFRDENGQPDLVDKRMGMTVTKLSDGRVLVAGGVELDTAGVIVKVHDSVEIFDPVHSQFVAAPFRLSQPRAFHTATLLDSGEVLLTGGITSAPNVATESVTLLNVDGPIYEGPLNTADFEARSEHVAQRLNDGSVLIVGGLGATGLPLTSTYRYFPTDQSFRRQGDMAEARVGHSFSAIERSPELAIVAGGKTNDTVLRSIEIFTIRPDQGGCAGGTVASALNGCWVSLGNRLELPEAVWGQSAIAVNSGREITVVGGYTSLDRSEVSTRVSVIPAEFSRGVVDAGQLTEGRGEVALSVSSDGLRTFILVAGGRNGPSPLQTMVRLVRQELNGVIQYFQEELAAGCIQPGIFPEARWGARAVTLDNETILVLGGGNRSINGYSSSRRAELYFPSHIPGATE